MLLLVSKVPCFPEWHGQLAATLTLVLVAALLEPLHDVLLSLVQMLKSPPHWLGLLGLPPRCLLLLLLLSRLCWRLCQQQVEAAVG